MMTVMEGLMVVMGSVLMVAVGLGRILLYTHCRITNLVLGLGDAMMVNTLEEVVGEFLLTEQVLVFRRTGGELCGVMDRGMEGVELVMMAMRNMDMVELLFLNFLKEIK